MSNFHFAPEDMDRGELIAAVKILRQEVSQIKRLYEQQQQNLHEAYSLLAEQENSRRVRF